MRYFSKGKEEEEKKPTPPALGQKETFAGVCLICIHCIV
jgi:hypothetical protein